MKTKADFALGRAGGGGGWAGPRRAPGLKGGRPRADVLLVLLTMLIGLWESPLCSVEGFWGSLMRCGGVGDRPGAVLEGLGLL